MKRIVLIATFIILALVAWITVMGLQTPPVPRQVTANTAPSKATPDELLALVNEERAKAGVAPLVIDANVQKAAQLKAEHMLANGYNQHRIPGTDSILTTDMENLEWPICSYVGENLVDTDNARFALGSWKSSPNHYNALKDAKYTLTGFGIAGGHIVQHFCVAK